MLSLFDFYIIYITDDSFYDTLYHISNCHSLFLSNHMDIFILSPSHGLLLESIWTQFTYWIYIFINCKTLDVNLNHNNFYLKSYISWINFLIQIDFIIKNVSWDYIERIKFWWNHKWNIYVFVNSNSNHVV